MQLAGVQAAVGAGLGVALMATLGQTPDGLVRVPTCRRRTRSRSTYAPDPGPPKETAAQVAAVLRPLLALPGNDPVLTLAKGA